MALIDDLRNKLNQVFTQGKKATNNVSRDAYREARELVNTFSPQNRQTMAGNLSQAVTDWRNKPSNSVIRSLATPQGQERTMQTASRNAAMLPSIVGQPLNTIAQTGVNRIAAPMMQVPYNVREAVGGQDKSRLERGLHGVMAVGGAMPFDDPVWAALDFVKGANLAENRGKGFKANLESGVKSASMEEYAGLGDVVGGEDNLKTALNLAELPLGIMGSVASSKNSAKKLAQHEDEIKRTIDLISINQIENINPAQWIENKRLINNAIEKVDSKFANNKEMRQLATKDPQQWLEASKSFLEAAYMQIKNPELSIGMSIGERRKIKDLKIDDAVPPKGVGVDTTPLNTGTTNTKIKLPSFEDFKQKVFAPYIGKSDASRTIGQEYGYKFRDIPEGEAGLHFLHVAQGTEKASSPQEAARVKEWKATMDELYKEAQEVTKASGDDIGFIRKYVPQYWKESTQEIDAKIRGAGQKLTAAKSRKINSYKEGMEKFGLTPEFTSPSQVMETYVRKLNQTKANIEMVKDMKANGLLKRAGSNIPPGWEQINGSTFPRSTFKTPDGETIIGNYYAPKDIARTINRIFSPQEGIAPLSIAAKISGKIQDVGLSGGLPLTPINSFATAIGLKEMTAGRVRSPIKALFTSLSPALTEKELVKNSGQIKKMQTRNVEFRGELQQSFFDGLKPTWDEFANNKTLGNFGGVLGQGWNNIVSDPTFKRFLPMLQINLFNDIERRALKKGMSAEKAADTAADAVRQFYGATDTSKQALANVDVSNIKTTLFFAPKFRESMINFWTNSVKALKNPTALENQNNVRFLIGAGLTYAIMDQINRQTTGHSMAQNPQGKQDKLLIPNGDTTIGIPFLPSIGTIPRGVYRQVSAMVKGDVKEAAMDAYQTYTSMATKPIGDVLMNQDYFGEEIYGENDPAATKHKKVVAYVGKQLLGHPYLKALADAKGDEGYKTITKALELPIRYYKTSSIENAPFWDKYHEAKNAAEQLQQLRYSNPEEAVAYYEKNKALIDSKEVLGKKVGAYFDHGEDGKFLKDNGVIEADGHKAFVGADGKFHLIDMNFDVPVPQLTGLPNLDKKLISSFKGDLSAKANNVLTLFENGLMTADEAEAILSRLELGKTAFGGKTGSKAKNPLMTLKKLPSSSYKPTRTKIDLGGIMLSGKTKRIAPPKVNVLKIKREE